MTIEILIVSAVGTSRSSFKGIGCREMALSTDNLCRYFPFKMASVQLCL